MAENTKRSAPSTSKQTESEEQDLYDTNIKNNEFTIGGLLKRGTFGDVYVIQDKKDSELYVLRVPREKEYGCQPDSMESETTLYTQEIEVQKEFQEKSRYILNFVREFYFLDRRGFIFEYCTFGSLKNVLNKLRSENMDINPFLTCRIFKQVAEAISFLHAKDGNSHRVTHNDVNHKSIYLTEDLDARLGSFGRATKALRTESRSESTDASHSHVAYAGFFLSKERSTNKKSPPSKNDDIFSLGASIYATLVDVDTRSKKFYEICKQNFDMKYPLMKKITKVGEEFGEDSAECKLMLNLVEIIDMCSVAPHGKKKKIEGICKKFTTQAHKLLGSKEGASGAAGVLKNILQENEKLKIEDVYKQLIIQTRLFEDFNTDTKEEASKLKNYLYENFPEGFGPGDTWVPITDLNEKFLK